MRISDWSSDVCSSDLDPLRYPRREAGHYPDYGAPGRQADRHHAGNVGEHAAQLRPARAGREGCRYPRPDSDARSGLTLSQKVLATDSFTCADTDGAGDVQSLWRSEEHTSELQSLMHSQYAFFC